MDEKYKYNCTARRAIVNQLFNRRLLEALAKSIGPAPSGEWFQLRVYAPFPRAIGRWVWNAVPGGRWCRAMGGGCTRWWR
eukprot:4850731-Pyramimonas_sp.AAC.1